MPYTTQTSDFWGWYTRHNNRVVWKHLYDAGIDLFAAGPSNNTQAFLDLTNVLPAMNGGLNRRWGVNTLAQSSPVVTQNIVRTFIYNYPQNANNVSGTQNTNLIIGTDNQNFFCWNDSGAPFTGYGPTSFGSVGIV